jgi:hypothetical protein
MLSKFINSIILLSSLANVLKAYPASHSLVNPFRRRPKSLHPLAFIEKRGRPATRRASDSSVDSESSSPLEVPVLKTAAIDDGVNNGQKKKRLRSDEQKSKIKEAARKAYARIKDELKRDPAAFKEWKSSRRENDRNRNARKREENKGDPDAMAAAKEKSREKNKSAKTKRLASFKDNPAAAIAFNLNRKQMVDRRKAKQIAKFDGDHVAIANFDVENKAAAKLKRDGKKMEKKEYDSQKRLAVNALPASKALEKEKTRMKRARYEAKRFEKFTANFDDKYEAKAAWDLEKKRLNRIVYLKRKPLRRKALEKRALEANSNPPISLRLKENELEDWMVEDAMIYHI